MEIRKQKYCSQTVSKSIYLPLAFTFEETFLPLRDRQKVKSLLGDYMNIWKTARTDSIYMLTQLQQTNPIISNVKSM